MKIAAMVAASVVLAAVGSRAVGSRATRHDQLIALDRPRVTAAANLCMTRAPQTIVAFRARRSTGGPHDFFSEGDYWWPDPARPGGPYIRRDGQSNPDNFVDHRRALMRLSVDVPTLAAAWRVTGDRRYADHARRHLRAWFVDEASRMNPRLPYAQAIHGITPGRPSTSLYGEGFQMLTQTGGTISQPLDYSQYTDAKHYRIPTSGVARGYYGLLAMTPPDEETRLLAFTSCSRFSGRFELSARDPGKALAPGSPGGPGKDGGHDRLGGADRAGRTDRAALRVIVDTEGLVLDAGESWPLEEWMFSAGPDRSKLLGLLADRLAAHHPPLRTPRPPTGWCSWYCFGPNVTAQQVLDNLDVIASQIPTLKYIQIDDGYQSAMGDWLETGRAFQGNVRTVLAEIRRRGFEPAIWVAPLVAEEQSNLFRQHPDFFIADSGGAPLRSDRVTFGGWRRGPWYALDGTHPGAQAHLEHVFRVMREEWGCTYFKLDANFWGAMHGGRFHDARATRVEAYRRGMEAVRRGAGDRFLLGCNHPMWPSVGLIHGSRSSNDIKRTWDRIATTARQNLSRNWQNGRLWWNDPDAVVLAGDLTDRECQFHATAIYASGGMLLSGDDLTAIPPARADMLRKLVPPTGVAAEFHDARLDIGFIRLPDALMVCLFNWDDQARTLSFKLPSPSLVTDLWTLQSLGRREGALSLDLPPRSARLLKVV